MHTVLVLQSRSRLDLCPQ